MYRHFSFLLAALFVFTGISEAQTLFPTTHRKWEFAVFGGTSLLGGKELSTPQQGEDVDSPRLVELEYESGYSAGFRIGESLGDHWGADFEYNYSSQPLEITNLSADISSLRLNHGIHRFHYQINFYPLPRSSRFRPYLSAGAGMVMFYTKGSSKEEAEILNIDIKDRWKAAFNWGGGLKYLIRDHVVVRFRITDQVTGIPDYGFPSTAHVDQEQYTPGLRTNGSLHNWLLTIGLGYQWGE